MRSHRRLCLHMKCILGNKYGRRGGFAGGRGRLLGR